MVPLLEVREEYLQAAFNEVQTTYGSIEAYFKAGLGLSDETIAALKKILLTP
jgi:protein-tyrosine phosphatase